MRHPLIFSWFLLIKQLRDYFCTFVLQSYPLEILHFWYTLQLCGAVRFTYYKMPYCTITGAISSTAYF